MRRAEKKYHNCAPAHVTGTRSLFLGLTQVILTYEKITLDEFCMLVVQHRQNSSLSSMVRLVIVIYFRTLVHVRLEDDEVFASDMTDIGLQFHEPDAAPAPVTVLPVVLQKPEMIESRAE